MTEEAMQMAREALLENDLLDQVKWIRGTAKTDSTGATSGKTPVVYDLTGQFFQEPGERQLKDWGAEERANAVLKLHHTEYKKVYPYDPENDRVEVRGESYALGKEPSYFGRSQAVLISLFMRQN